MTEPLPIPESAMPVVLILRAEVPRPSPESVIPMTEKDDRIRFGTPTSERHCPMGLHKSALRTCPMFPDTFLGIKRAAELSGSNTKCFALWWDSIPYERASEAIALVWPEETV